MRTWLRPVLTAALFPVVLLASIAALDEFSGSDRLPWTKSRHSREQIISLAEAQCFSSYADHEKFRPWHAKLSDGRWLIRGTRSGLPWIISGHFDTVMLAVIDDQSEVMSSCSVFAYD
jgi:hypothetical protein